MHNSLPLAFAALAALSAGGCNQAPKAVDTGKIQDSIRAEEARWEKDYAAKDLNALAGHYTDDAALVDPGSKVASSDVDRRKELETFVSDPNLKLTFASDRITVASSGDLAASRGHFSLVATDKATNKPVASEGTYLTVYQKQGDGSWKAIEDFITPGPAPKS